MGDTVAIGAAVVGVIVGGIIGRLKGGIGFVLAATGWWFILALWAPIYGAILKIEFFQPLAALLVKSPTDCRSSLRRTASCSSRS